MTKRVLALLEMALLPALLAAKNSGNSADFSGTWTLNRAESKGVPSEVESYVLKIHQSENRLAVESNFKCDMEPPVQIPNGLGGSNQPTVGQGSGVPGVGPNGPMGGMGMPAPMGGVGMGGVGMGMPGPMGGVGMGGVGMGGMGMGMPGVGIGVGGPIGGNGNGGGRPEKKLGERIAAFNLYPPSATYSLDGGSTSAKLGGHSSSTANLKAGWQKGGKQLALRLDGQSDSAGQNNGLRMTDEWRLSKDGRFLTVARTIHMPQGTSTVHLVFNRQSDSTSKAAK
jgi:hypothetical protein